MCVKRESGDVVDEAAGPARPCQPGAGLAEVPATTPGDSEGQMNMQLDKAVRAQNRIVAQYLMHYPDLRRQWCEYREELLGATQRSDIAEPMPGRASVRPVSDPTSAAALALADRRLEFAIGDGSGAIWATLTEMERWLELCEEVEQRLPWKMQIVLRLRQATRMDSSRTGGWVPYAQRRYAEELADKLGKDEVDVWIESRNTFYGWWNRIVEYAARLAAVRGLLA